MTYHIRHRSTGLYLRGYLPTHPLRWVELHEATGHDGRNLANRTIRDCKLDRRKVEVTED